MNIAIKVIQRYQNCTNDEAAQFIETVRKMIRPNPSPADLAAFLLTLPKPKQAFTPADFARQYVQNNAKFKLAPEVSPAQVAKKVVSPKGVAKSKSSPFSDKFRNALEVNEDFIARVASLLPKTDKGNLDVARLLLDECLRLSKKTPRATNEQFLTAVRNAGKAPDEFCSKVVVKKVLDILYGNPKRPSVISIPSGGKAG